MLNEYWDLSGWYIFDYLDKKAHIEAKAQIWDCETISAEIKYFWKVTQEEMDNYYMNNWDCSVIWNKCFIYMPIYDKILATFTFVKKK